jgi:excisionase family DNA binding protein
MNDHEQNTDRSEILTIPEVAKILRCSKAHVANAINGRIRGMPQLTHIAMGRRKLIRREWLDRWMETNKSSC